MLRVFKRSSNKRTDSPRPQLPRLSVRAVNSRGKRGDQNATVSIEELIIDWAIKTLEEAKLERFEKKSVGSIRKVGKRKRSRL